MAKNRKAFIETIKAGLTEIDPGNPSIVIICDTIAKMSQKELDEYIKRLENGVNEKPNIDQPRELIPIVVPNGKPTKISAARNFKIAEKWGVKLFERVWCTDKETNTNMLTNIPQAVWELPMCRQAQTLAKGISYAESDTRLDSRTNAVASSAKGSGLSGPELQSLLSQGHQMAAIELMKFRGGDDKAYRHMAKALAETGHYEMEQYPLQTRAKSTDVAAIYLKASHIQTDL